MNTNYEITFDTKKEDIASDYLSLNLILKGNVTCQSENQNKHYHVGDLILINSYQNFLILEDSDVSYMSLRLSNNYFSHYIEDKNIYFHFEEVSQKIHDDIKTLLAKIGITYLRKGKFHQLHIDQMMIQLIEMLVKFIPYQSRQELIHEHNKDDVFASLASEFINQHYMERIGLDDLSDYINLSSSYTSRLFTKKLGTSFNSYLNKVRTRNAEHDLKYSDISITDIAMKNGFSNSTSLAKHFKLWYHMTPGDYRKEFQVKDLNQLKMKPLNKQSIKGYIQYLSSFVNNQMDVIIHSAEPQKEIDIQLEDSLGYLNKYNHIVQIGSIVNMRVHRYREQLLEVKDRVGLDTVLVQDLVNDTSWREHVVASDEIIPHSHQYMTLDECLLFLMNHQIHLSIRLRPPHSATAFQAYCDTWLQILKHFINMTTHSSRMQLSVIIDAIDLKQYIQLYEVFNRYISNVKFIVNYQDFSNQKNNLKLLIKDHPEQVNMLAFEANQNDVVNLEVSEDIQYQYAKNHINETVEAIVEWLPTKQKAMPLMLLNWNTLTGNSNLTNGEYFRAGIIFKQLLDINEKVCTVGYWLNYELHQKYGVMNEHQLMGIDLYHQFDGKRPAFFTSNFFRMLQNNVRFRNEECMVVGDDTHLQIVVWDADHYNPYYTISEQPNVMEKRNFKIEINQLQSGLYKIKHYTLDKENGALYRVWQQHNTTYGMDQETIDYVNRISYPKLDIAEVEVEETLTYHLKVMTNSIHIIEVNKYV
ncbi:helix-turn-helix domain-containing protein [Staphylococcus haemolyticus]|nr:MULTISPECIES: helix-turn-helix domain-containing protein [Staphylococcus]MCE5036147.1 helix-turn-helix domain-containing protein [Staphylococcus haemolyticus]RIO64773.1 helix-turn-helix domain-containing protein [Staphylococcus haemolyticus]TRL69251.1 helix-turn-helix domain-containing protein [Staphylococcus haemolyticus]